MTEYPNREHANADKAARRRAITALGNLITDAQAMAKRLNDPDATIYMEDGRRFQDSSDRAAAELTRLETLREVREWHAADFPPAVTEGHPHGGLGPHPDWKGHNDYAVHRHNMTNGRAEWLTRGDGTPVTTLGAARTR